MELLFLWIRNNKLKFFVIDSILLLGNISILKFIRIGFFIDTDLVAGFIGACIFFGMIFLVTIIWVRVTQKYNFFFIQINVLNNIGKKILFCSVILFLILNLLFICLIWINKNFIGEKIVFYFAMPWLIMIFSNVHNSINP